MQVHLFPSGGCVAHRVTVGGCRSHCSIWVDADGRMTDAELIDRARRARPVKVDGPLWGSLKLRAPVILRNAQRAATSQHGARV